MLAGGQATPSVIPDVQLNISPADDSVVSVAKPAIEPQFPIAPAAALGPQQGIVGARQVDAETHEQTVTRQALGEDKAPVQKADGSGDIGDDAKGSLALENEEQKRFDNARRGFRSVPMSMPGQQGAATRPPGIAPGQPVPPGFPQQGSRGQQQQPQQPQPQQQEEPQGVSDPYRQQSLFRNFDARISGSKLIRTKAAKLSTRDGAYYTAQTIQAQPSYDTWNPMTQGVAGWAMPMITSNNFLDRTSEIPSLQYNGAQGLMDIYDPCPAIVAATGAGFRNRY
jgi:hypothetical protein